MSPIGSVGRSVRGRRLPDAIPDSAIHHWRMDEGSGDTVADDIGSADGTRFGPTWTSGTWVGDFALDGDGTDDYVETTTLGDWGSSHGVSFSIAFSIETSDTEHNYVMGSRSGGSSGFRWISVNKDTTGDIAINLRDDSSDQIRVYSGDVNLNDGEKHRVVFNMIDTGSNNVDIWVDGSKTDSYTEADEEPSNWSNLSYSWMLFTFNNQGSPRDSKLNGLLDNTYLTNDSLTDTEIQDDYDNQPWT